MTAERRLRGLNTWLAIVILVLLGRIAWQETRINRQIDLAEVERRLVETLQLKEGDEIELRAADAEKQRLVEVGKQPTKEELLAELRKYRGMVPAGYRFRREDAYEPD